VRGLAGPLRGRLCEGLGGGHDRREALKVALELVNVPPGDLPAHIHLDTSKNPSSIRYGLSNVVNGKSETMVVTPIAYLRRGHGRFSINVHKADPDLPIIGCGDIPPG